nr:hypothetical protein CFP56_09923 [Quercus suber]
MGRLPFYILSERGHGGIIKETVASLAVGNAASGVHLWSQRIPSSLLAPDEYIQAQLHAGVPRHRPRAPKERNIEREPRTLRLDYPGLGTYRSRHPGLHHITCLPAHHTYVHAKFLSQPCINSRLKCVPRIRISSLKMLGRDRTLLASYVVTWENTAGYVVPQRQPKEQTGATSKAAKYSRVLSPTRCKRC